MSEQQSWQVTHKLLTAQQDQRQQCEAASAVDSDTIQLGSNTFSLASSHHINGSLVIKHMLTLRPPALCGSIAQHSTAQHSIA